MQNKFYLLGYIALFFLSGCTGLPLDTKITDPHDPEIKDHVIAIGKDGELRDPLTGEKMPSSKERDDYLTNIVEKIKDHAEKKTNGDAELLIYIHGGLNKESSGLKRALANYQLIQNSGKYPMARP